MPPCALDALGVDVDGRDDRVGVVGAVLAVVDDAGVVAFVARGDLGGDDDVVQGGASADVPSAAARAGTAVLLGVLGADVSAFPAHAPRAQRGRCVLVLALGAWPEVEAVDDVPVTEDVVGVAGGEFGEGGLGGPVVHARFVAPLVTWWLFAGLGVTAPGAGGLLVGEHRLQPYAVLDESVVGQQPLLDEECLGSGVGQFLEPLGEAARVSLQVPLLACLVVDVVLEVVGSGGDHVAPVEERGALGLPRLLRLDEPGGQAQ